MQTRKTGLLAAAVTRGRGLVCGAAVLAALSRMSALATERFLLHVDEVAGWDEPRALKGGVPFAKGALRDASRIRLVDAKAARFPSKWTWSPAIAIAACAGRC